jgi:hypothetical protein
VSFATGRPGNQCLIVDQLSFGLATVFTIKALHSARGIDELLLAGEERMATRAYLEPYLRLGRARLPGFAARTVHSCGYVFGMNISFHCSGYSCCEFFDGSNTSAYPPVRTKVKVRAFVAIFPDYLGAVDLQSRKARLASSIRIFRWCPR